MNIKPLRDMVVVLRTEEKDKTDGGIIIPDTVKEKPQNGYVVAVGPGRWDENAKRMQMEVQKGDRILFSKYAGFEIMFDEVDHVIMKENDILAILEG